VPPGAARPASTASRTGSLYQKIESCDRKPQRDMAERGDELFRTPGAFARIYKDIVTEPYSPWFGPRVEFEDRATAITNWEQRGIPGLLQTEAYARAYMPPEARSATAERSRPPPPHGRFLRTVPGYP
jgi:hypothetical protein